MSDFDSIFHENIFDSPSLLYEAYCALIVACYYDQYKDHAKADVMIQKCIDWLKSTDFFVAPASTKYHDAEQAGLLKHTVLVAKTVNDLSKLPQFKDVNLSDAILASLVHDWCKIDFYEEYYKNVKDENTGSWYQQKAYRCKGAAIPLGHGVTSLFMAQKFFKINIEQALAIRWHMGDFTTSETEKYDLMEANKHPMVQMLQIADKMSATLT